MKFLILGDFFYDLDSIPDDIREISEKLKKEESHVILNLEGPVTDGSGRKIWKRGAHLKQEGACMEALKILGVKGVTLSNNHMMDYGAKGLFDTISALEKAGILHTGAGADLNSALKPMIFRDDKETIAIFNFGWNAEETVYAGYFRAGCAPRKKALILSTLDKYVKENPEHSIVVLMHWGFEHNLYPQPFDTELAHKICGIENVCAVIGHHSHCPQPYEIYNGKPIFYSLGNFYFGSKRNIFSKRKFKSIPEDMGNYGIAVKLDTATGKTGSCVIRYDAGSDRMLFYETDELPVRMPDISTASYEYGKLLKETAAKENPVLLRDGLESSLTVFRYNVYRNIKKYI
ncbi:MAG: CapA family protein [Lachnospiraceae bacterium]|nr:CapA family protein [Lachnospiraceae bacterium]